MEFQGTFTRKPHISWENPWFPPYGNIENFRLRCSPKKQPNPSMKKSFTSQAARAQEVHLVAERLAAGDDVDTQDADFGGNFSARRGNGAVDFLNGT